jgi:NAD(P) transhydrogenase subunit beta
MFIAKEIQMAAYLFASILFILSLGGLSSQESAKRGVLFGIVGMIVAIIATVLGKALQDISTLLEPLPLHPSLV